MGRLREVISAAQAGDTAALDAFCEYCRPIIETAYLKRGISKDDTEDIVQEALLVIASKLHLLEYRDQRQTDGWIYRTAIRKMCSHIRPVKNQRLRLLAEEDGVYPDDECAPPSTDPHDCVVGDDLQRLTLAHMRSPFREVAAMLMSGLTECDIQRVTGTNLGTVKSRLYRARGIARRVLTDVGVAV